MAFADTCYNKKYAETLKEKQPQFIISINNGETGGGWPEGSRDFAEFEHIIETTIPYENCKNYRYCNKNPNNGIISFQAEKGHNEIPEILLNEALFPTHNLFKLFLPPQ